MRKDVGPGANPDFVLAMKHLFDREQMKQAIALDYAVVANDQPIDPTNRFYFAGLPQRPFDLDKAKFHLQKSGITRHRCRSWPRRRRCTRSRWRLLLQQTAQQLGLDLDVKRMPADGYWSNHWLNSQVGFGNVNPRPSADMLLTLFFKSDAAWNESRWKNEKFDQLLIAARGETDLAKRKQMYADMQVMVHEDAGIGIPLFLASIDGHSDQAQGPVADPAGRPDGLHVRRARLARRLIAGHSSARGAPTMNHAHPQVLAQRIALALLSLLAVSVIVFAITAVLPGDAAQEQLGQDATPEALAALREQMGLDVPAPERYAIWLIGMVTGDPGRSTATQLPVAELIASRLPNSLLLAAVTALVLGADRAGAGHRLGDVARLVVRPRRLDHGGRRSSRCRSSWSRRSACWCSRCSCAGCRRSRSSPTSSRSGRCCAPSRCRC